MSKPDPLVAVLQRALREYPEGTLCVSFSGGPDSTALLHALASMPEARARKLRALHIDHGLHADSAHWAERARQFCAVLEVPCSVVRVHVQPHGEGLEAAARHARYAALGATLGAGEWLLLGHHRDDQAETVLLKLMRGAGPDGLGGMRPMRPLGRGNLWRPLLNVARAELRAYVDRHALPALHDPSNDDTRLSRNLLRQQILPALSAQWPQAAESIVHSAALCREASNTLRDTWMGAFHTLYDPATHSLDCHGWLDLPAALRHPLLDHWLHQRGLRAPTSAQRAQIERQASQAAAGTLPLIHWPGVDLHLWKGRMWAQAPAAPIDPHWQASWHGEALNLPGGSVLLLDGPARTEPLTVRLRRGGERLMPAGDRHTRELRDLFQRAAVPPWQRHGYPLIFERDELLAAGDVWVTERGRQVLENLVWRRRPA